MRPLQSTIIERSLDGNQYEQVFVPEDDYLYVLVYQGRPVGIRLVARDGYPQNKYKKTSWTTRGHGEATVRRLNRNFDTTDFGLVAIKIT